MGKWWLGPVGSLVQIPAPADPMDVNPALIGAVHESLSGAVSVDRVAQPRSWAMSWRALDEDTLTYLAAVGSGQIPGPLRLIDPLRRNRLARQVATGGSVRRSTARWTAYDGSTIEWVPLTDAPVAARGAISWTLPDLSGSDLFVASGRETGTDRTPVLPSESLRITARVRGTTGTDVALGVDVWDSAGASITSEGTLTALDATTWSALSFTYPVPASGRVSLSPYVRAPSGQTAATVQVTGLQVALSSAPDVWTPGGGAPVVIASELTETYEVVDRHTFAMLLREAVV